MPITIQEIIASDTISQLVDKTNFNFDQLLLNGGGPAGPVGPIGPVGPAGGRGPKGTTWYEDTAIVAPGTTPTATFPTATPLTGDYYLQFNGTVWEYIGAAWVATTVNLQGPPGAQGAGGGFAEEFGGAGTSQPITLQTARYNGPIGLGNGATAAPGGNEGVPSVLIGGVVSNTTALTGIPLTTSFIVPDEISKVLTTIDTSLLIHQKDAAARGITFHGGYAALSGNPEKFEQNVISQLSSIGITNDDRLILSAPKSATAAVGINDIIGFEVSVPKRSQQFTAGKAISFQTGIDNVPAVVGENSDFTIDVGAGSSAPGNKFVLTTTGTTNTTVLQAGGGFPVNLSQNSQEGVIQLQAGLINLTSSVNQNIQLNAGGQLKLDTTQGTSPAGQISLRSASGGILITAQDGNVTLQQNKTGPASSDIIIENLASFAAGVTDTGGDIYIRGNSQIILRKQDSAAIAMPSIVFDYDYYVNNDPTKPLLPHTRFVGHSTWSKRGLSSGTQPPNEATYYYNNLDQALTTAASTFVRSGDSNLVDMQPGSTMHEWLGGTQTVSGVAAEKVRIGLGDELGPGLSYPVPAGGSPSGAVNDNDAYDNSLAITVRSFNDYYEYFSSSQNKTALGGRLVYKRSNDTNSIQNNDPSYSRTSPSGGAWTTGPYQWGWDLRYDNTMPNGRAAASTLGMPTTADLTTPVIFLNYGPGIGYRDTGTGTSNINTNFNAYFKFPVGAYPGQRLTVVIKNQAGSWTVPGKFGGASLSNYWGQIKILFPRFRQQVPAGNGYSDWYKEQSGLDEIDGCHTINTSTFQLYADQGVTRVTVLECIWDGATATQYGKNLNAVDPNNSRDNIVTQYGWTIISNGVATQGQTNGSVTL